MPPFFFNLISGQARASFLVFGLWKVPFADIAQLGERQTEDLKVPGSIPGVGICFFLSAPRKLETRAPDQVREWSSLW